MLISALFQSVRGFHDCNLHILIKLLKLQFTKQGEGSFGCSVEAEIRIVVVIGGFEETLSKPTTTNIVQNELKLSLKASVQ